MQVGASERWRALVGGRLGVLFAVLLCRGWAGSDLAHHPWLVAPIGASAVLVFAVPASPLAQPCSVIGGNTLSALVGALCAMVTPDPAFFGVAAVALAIGMMFWKRCPHPVGGAAALLSAKGGVSLHFAIFPVLTNCLLLVMAGMAYNNLTGRTYPQVPSTQGPAPGAGPCFSTADLDAALAHYNQVLNVSRDDLQELFHHAESAVYERRIGELTCGDVMSTEPLSVQLGTSIKEPGA